MILQSFLFASIFLPSGFHELACSRGSTDYGYNLTDGQQGKRGSCRVVDANLRHICRASRREGRDSQGPGYLGGLISLALISCFDISCFDIPCFDIPCFDLWDKRRLWDGFNLRLSGTLSSFIRGELNLREAMLAKLKKNRWLDICISAGFYGVYCAILIWRNEQEVQWAHCWVAMQGGYI